MTSAWTTQHEHHAERPGTPCSRPARARATRRQRQQTKRVESRSTSRDADEAELLADRGEHEVGVPLRDRVRAAESRAGAPRAAGRQRPQPVRDLVAAGHAVVPRIEPDHHALPHRRRHVRSSSRPRIRPAAARSRRPRAGAPARDAVECRGTRTTAPAPARDPSAGRRTRARAPCSTTTGRTSRQRGSRMDRSQRACRRRPAPTVRAAARPRRPK